MVVLCLNLQFQPHLECSGERVLGEVIGALSVESTVRPMMNPFPNGQKKTDNQRILPEMGVVIALWPRTVVSRDFLEMEVLGRHEL